MLRQIPATAASILRPDERSLALKRGLRFHVALYGRGSRSRRYIGQKCQTIA